MLTIVRQAKEDEDEYATFLPYCWSGDAFCQESSACSVADSSWSMGAIALCFRSKFWSLMGCLSLALPFSPSS